MGVHMAYYNGESAKAHNYNDHLFYGAHHSFYVGYVIQPLSYGIDYYYDRVLVFQH